MVSLMDTGVPKGMLWLVRIWKDTCMAFIKILMWPWNILVKNTLRYSGEQFPRRQEIELIEIYGTAASTSSPWWCLLWVFPLTLLSQIAYTEQFESKQESSASSINLVRCSRLYSTNSQDTYEDQEPRTMSSISQRNPSRNYENVDKGWLSNYSQRNNSLPLANQSQGRSRSFTPFSDSFLEPITHTIILDFTMVHFVDAQAIVVLRQVSPGAVLEELCSLPTLTPSPI